MSPKSTNPTKSGGLYTVSGYQKKIAVEVHTQDVTRSLYTMWQKPAFPMYSIANTKNQHLKCQWENYSTEFIGNGKFLNEDISMIFLTSKILKQDRKIAPNTNEPEMSFQKKTSWRRNLPMSHAEFFQRKRKRPAQKKEKILKDTLLQNFGLENINPLDCNKKEHNLTYLGTIDRFFLNTGFPSNVLAKLKGPPCIRTRVLYTVVSLHLSSI